MVAVQARSSGGELVSVSIVDKIDGENSLEDVLCWGLDPFPSLVGVLGNARLACDVSSADGTANNSKHGVWSLNSQLVGDQLIEPSSSDGIVLETQEFPEA